jgi:hypothetical protein
MLLPLLLILISVWMTSVIIGVITKMERELKKQFWTFTKFEEAPDEPNAISTWDLIGISTRAAINGAADGFVAPFIYLKSSI